MSKGRMYRKDQCGLIFLREESQPKNILVEDHKIRQNDNTRTAIINNR